MAIVSVRGLTKVFKQGDEKVYALRDVSLDIQEEEIFGMLGPNGAGKTTFLNVLTGLLLPEEGRVEVLGLDVTKKREEVLKRINSATGETEFHPLLNIDQLLNFFGRFYGVSAEEREERIRELAEQFGISDLMDRRWSWLSTGQRMRVTLAKSLINEPELLLLDEPTMGLDPDIAIETRKFIKRIRDERGVTILLTSHYMKEVEELCDRVAFLSRGQIVDVGTVHDLLESGRTGTEMVVVLDEVRDESSLVAMGFSVEGREAVRTLRRDDDINEILEGLLHEGYQIQDVKTKKADLEDYFLRMVHER